MLFLSRWHQLSLLGSQQEQRADKMGGQEVQWLQEQLLVHILFVFFPQKRRLRCSAQAGSGTAVSKAFMTNQTLPSLS